MRKAAACRRPEGAARSAPRQQQASHRRRPMRPPRTLRAVEAHRLPTHAWPAAAALLRRRAQQRLHHGFQGGAEQEQVGVLSSRSPFRGSAPHLAARKGPPSTGSRHRLPHSDVRRSVRARRDGEHRLPSLSLDAAAVGLRRTRARLIIENRIGATTIRALQSASLSMANQDGCGKTHGQTAMPRPAAQQGSAPCLRCTLHAASLAAACPCACTVCSCALFGLDRGQERNAGCRVPTETGAGIRHADASPTTRPCPLPSRMELDPATSH